MQCPWLPVLNPHFICGRRFSPHLFGPIKLKQDSLVLVTGGTGFVGQTLVKRLIDTGYRVRVVTRTAHGFLPDKLRENVSTQDRLNFYEGDICHFGSMESAFEGVDYVVHGAALVNSIAPYPVFERANVTATENLSALALRRGIKKMVHVSTSDVFGIPASGEVLSETSSYRPWGEPYPDTKIKAAEVVKAYQEKGLCTVIVYPGWVYGPGDRAFFPTLAHQLRQGLWASWCKGHSDIHLVYIDDLVEALMVALKDPAADNDDFLILDEKSGVTLDALCRRIGIFLGLEYKVYHFPYGLMHAIAWGSQCLCRLGLTRRPLLSTTDVKSFGHPFKYSTEKAREILKWSPKTSSETGIERALQWYQRHMDELDGRPTASIPEATP